MSQPRSPIAIAALTVQRTCRWPVVPLSLLVAAASLALAAQQQDPASSRERSATATATARDFVRSVRLTGTVEAVQATTVAAPRLSGPGSNSLLITELVAGGTKVQPGDLIVEFDRQLQLQTALDRRAELNDIEQQIRRREAEARAAAARDDSERQQAQSALERAKLELLKNRFLPRIQAEKNEQAVEQADANVRLLKTTYDLKRRAAAADIEILRIRSAKAKSAMEQAEANASRMAVHSTIAGLAVIRSAYAASGVADIQEGQEVRPGMAIVDIVNPERMRVRARVNQVDVNDLRLGQPVRVGLDAYPDLSFSGRVAQISPLGIVSTLSPKVRQFVVLVDVDGSHPHLMPDLTASMDVELERLRGVLVVPRDAVRFEADKAIVKVRDGSGFADRTVKTAARSAGEIVIASGIEAGAIVARHIASRGGE